MSSDNIGLGLVRRDSVMIPGDGLEKAPRGGRSVLDTLLIHKVSGSGHRYCVGTQTVHL